MLADEDDIALMRVGLDDRQWQLLSSKIRFILLRALPTYMRCRLRRRILTEADYQFLDQELRLLLDRFGFTAAANEELH